MSTQFTESRAAYKQASSKIEKSMTLLDNAIQSLDAKERQHSQELHNAYDALDDFHGMRVSVEYAPVTMFNTINQATQLLKTIPADHKNKAGVEIAISLLEDARRQIQPYLQPVERGYDPKKYPEPESGVLDETTPKYSIERVGDRSWYISRSDSVMKDLQNASNSLSELMDSLKGINDPLLKESIKTQSRHDFRIIAAHIAALQIMLTEGAFDLGHLQKTVSMLDKIKENVPWVSSTASLLKDILKILGVGTD